MKQYPGSNKTKSENHCKKRKQERKQKQKQKNQRILVATINRSKRNTNETSGIIAKQGMQISRISK